MSYMFSVPRAARSGGLALLLLLAVADACAHGHMPALDDRDPLSAGIRLCNDVVDAALQALKDRDLERPPRSYPGEDLRARLMTEVTRHVFAEPQIRSQKFAMAYARSHCNDVLQKRAGPPP